MRTTGPNRGVNTLPTWNYTATPERTGNPGALGNKPGGLPEWIINPYVTSNPKVADETEAKVVVETEAKYNRLMTLLEEIH